MQEGFKKIIGSKSKTFIAFCFCFIFGVGAFSFSENNDLGLFFYISAFVILFFIIIFWNKRAERFILLCFLFFVFGAIRFLFTIPSNLPKNISHYNSNKMQIVGLISEEPSTGLSQTKYVLEIEECGDGVITCPKGVSGKILLTIPNYPAYNYGDEVTINCTLQDPRNSIDSTFDYKKYLAGQGIWSICGNPKIVNAAPSKSLVFKFKQVIFRFKSKVANQINRLWPEPQSSFMAGLLYGSRNGLPQELSDNFSRTGVSHIIAVSGFNITIIVSCLMSLLIGAGLYRKQSFWIVVCVTILFVIFTGASASVVRAGVMGILVLFSQHIGRSARIGNTLVFTAAVMILFNPYVLVWDAGFQLSFLATLGLVYLSPIIKIGIVKYKMPEFIRESFGTTISAIIATLPLILFQFGRLSMVAPLVNILILWIIPWLMLFGFVSMLLGVIIFPLGQVLAWVSGLGLNYVIMIVNWFGNQSWSGFNLKVPVWFMIFLYILIIFVFKRKYEKKSQSV